MPARYGPWVLNLGSAIWLGAKGHKDCNHYTAQRVRMCVCACACAWRSVKIAPETQPAGIPGLSWGRNRRTDAPWWDFKEKSEAGPHLRKKILLRVRLGINIFTQKITICGLEGLWCLQSPLLGELFLMMGRMYVTQMTLDLPRQWSWFGDWALSGSASWACVAVWFQVYPPPPTS